MFDFDASKLLIVGVIALIFIPSKDLPRVLRQVGQFVAKARKMASEFQGQFMDAMKEADMADLRKEAQKLAETARIDVGLDHMTDLRSHVTSTIEATPRSTVQGSDRATDGVATKHETMDGAGFKDPNAELRRLTTSGAEMHPPASIETSHAPVPDDGVQSKPIEHSAL